MSARPVHTRLRLVRAGIELRHGRETFGCHVGQRSAQVGASLALRAGGSCKIKIEQHRSRVGRDEHVGGLDVVVQYATIVCVLEGLGEPGAPPGDRLCKPAAAERLAPFRPGPGLFGRPELVQDLQ